MRRSGVAGAARLVLVEGATLLHPEPAMFEAMLTGWRTQQESRLLAAPTIDMRDKTMRRFQRLAVVGIDARAARRAALLQLAAELPAPVLAGSLGITTATAVDWVKAAGGDWANYAADITRTRFATRAESPPDATPHEFRPPTRQGSNIALHRFQPGHEPRSGSRSGRAVWRAVYGGRPESLWLGLGGVDGASCQLRVG